MTDSDFTAAAAVLDALGNFCPYCHSHGTLMVRLNLFAPDDEWNVNSFICESAHVSELGTPWTCSACNSYHIRQGDGSILWFGPQARWCTL